MSLFAVAAGALLAACAQKPERPDLPDATPVAALVDFSGSWDMDYSRGDNLTQTLTKLFRQLNRSAQGPATSNSRMRVGTSTGSANSIITLARIADLVTRPELLEIEQTADAIEVGRLDEYAFTCNFGSRKPQVVETTFGTELCGWDGQKMVFHLTLPDNLTIVHRMTRSPDGRNLNIATTLTSPSSPVPFTLSRFYTRFDPLPPDYDCLETFSKKRVCSKGRSGS